MDPKIIKQLNETREAFKQRFEQAKSLNAKDRKILYKKWRAEIGDDAARETAKFVESYKKGDNPKTANGVKWEHINDAYEEVDLFDMRRKDLI
jgi:hypothetical protein